MEKIMKQIIIIGKIDSIESVIHTSAPGILSLFQALPRDTRNEVTNSIRSEATYHPAETPV